MKNSRLLHIVHVAFLSFCCSWRESACLIPLPVVRYRRTTTTSPNALQFQSSWVLHAMKPNKNKNKSNKNNNKNDSQTTPAGFGTPSVVTPPNQKVRTISGFTASGTKPLRQAANTFDRLVQQQKRQETQGDGDVGTPSIVWDVYVRSPLNNPNLFWFVGKVARCVTPDQLVGTSIPTEHEAIVSQKRLILEYAKRELRPQNLGGPFEQGLELWLAPGNSEMDVVQNKVSLIKVQGSVSTLSEGFHVGDVGYNPEIYVGEEIQKGGLRVTRDEEGCPIKPVFDVFEAQ